MKRTYITPIAEKLAFDYINVVAASGYITRSGEAEGCTITENGWTNHPGKCTHLKNSNKDCW